MLAIIVGILGLLGSAEHEYTSTDVTSTDTIDVHAIDTLAVAARDTIILNTVDTTVARLLTVNRVLIIGNKVTRDRIISRELNLKPGDTISTTRLPQVLLKDKNKIYNLRLFNTVTLRVLEMGNDQIDILIEVSERWYLFPSPIFELADRNFNEWWQNYDHDLTRVNYGMRLAQYNFRGRNETVRLTAQFGFNRKFELSYAIPYIDRKQKRGLTFNLDYGAPKNLAYYTYNHKLVYLEDKKAVKQTYGAGVSFSFRKSFYATHVFSIGYRNSTIADTLYKAAPAVTRVDYYKGGATHQNFVGISYSFNTDHRDVILYPLKGYQFGAIVSYSGLGSTSVNLFEMNATLAWHRDLKNKFYLSNFTAGYFSTPNTQPYALYSALGYRKQLVRGYEIYVIEGPAFALNKTTFKKRIFSRTWRVEDVPLEQFRHFPLAIYVKGYMDYGYVQNYPAYRQLGYNTQLSDHLLAGVGGGLDVVTLYDLVFRFEYTFTREGTHGFFFNVKKEF